MPAMSAGRRPCECELVQAPQTARYRPFYDTVLEATGDSERFESLLGRVRLWESVALVLGGLGEGALAAAKARPAATAHAVMSRRETRPRATMAATPA